MASGEKAPDAQVPPTAAGDVAAAHARWWDGLANGDVAVLDALLADDLTFHSPGGNVITKRGFLEGLRSGRTRYDSIAADEPLIRLHGEAAIVTGRVDIQLQAEGSPKTRGLYYTAVYGWTPAGWRMRAYQATLRADARGADRL